MADQDSWLLGGHTRQGPPCQGMTIGIMSSKRKDLGQRTPTPFMSGLKVFSPFTHVNNTQPRGLKPSLPGKANRIRSLHALV
jgi:hypothetical protein